MKRRHHLEWHRFRNHRTPDWRRRGDRVHSLELVVAGTIGPAGASLVDPLDGHFMRNPSLMELANVRPHSTSIVVDLPEATGHDLLKAGQFVLQVLQRVMENVQFSSLLPDYFTKVTTLTES